MKCDVVSFNQQARLASPLQVQLPKSHGQPTFLSLGGIVVRISHHDVCDGCIFVVMRSFGEMAAWVHQAHDTEQFNLFYIYRSCTP